jgi:hypothetical protein
VFNRLLDFIIRPAAPQFTADTFIVWEPCTYSHAEVVPGYVKYLLDLGFKVAVFVTPERYKEGLFSRIDDSRITLHTLSQRAIRRTFRQHGIGQAHGIIVTTARKISGKADYSGEQALFAGRSTRQKLLLVEHDVRPATDVGALTADIITLSTPHYASAVTTVVSPHYFGNVSITGKSQELTRFITIGAMRSKRRNTQLLVDAVSNLHESGSTNFNVTVIGRGDLRGVPHHLRQYFDIKGRVDFSTLYAEMEQADFFLTLLDPDNASHERYITTGTSGSFQLIRGFGTPCLIAEKFALTNGFNNINSLVYRDNAGLVNAMRIAVNMQAHEYAAMQTALLHDAASIYQQSLENLHRLSGTPG